MRFGPRLELIVSGPVVAVLAISAIWYVLSSWAYVAFRASSSWPSMQKTSEDDLAHG